MLNFKEARHFSVKNNNFLFKVFFYSFFQNKIAITCLVEISVLNTQNSLPVSYKSYKYLLFVLSQSKQKGLFQYLWMKYRQNSTKMDFTCLHLIFVTSKNHKYFAFNCTLHSKQSCEDFAISVKTKCIFLNILFALFKNSFKIE